MTTAKIACANCGASLSLPEGVRYVTCEYCGSSLEIKRSNGAAYSEIKEQLDQLKEGIQGVKETTDKLMAAGEKQSQASSRVADELALPRLKEEAAGLRSTIGLARGRVTDMLATARVKDSAYLSQVQEARTASEAANRIAWRVVKFGLLSLMLFACLAMSTEWGKAQAIVLLVVLLLAEQHRGKTRKASKALDKLAEAGGHGEIPAEVTAYFSGSRDELLALIERALKVEAEIDTIAARLGGSPTHEALAFVGSAGGVAEPKWPTLDTELAEARKRSTQSYLIAGGVGVVVALSAITIAGSMIDARQRSATKDEALIAARDAVAAKDWAKAAAEAQRAIDAVGQAEAGPAVEILARAKAEPKLPSARTAVDARDWRKALVLLREIEPVLRKHHTDLPALLATAQAEVALMDGAEAVQSAEQLLAEGKPAEGLVELGKAQKALALAPKDKSKEHTERASALFEKAITALTTEVGALLDQKKFGEALAQIESVLPVLGRTEAAERLRGSARTAAEGYLPILIAEARSAAEELDADRAQKTLERSTVMARVYRLGEKADSQLAEARKFIAGKVGPGHYHLMLDGFEVSSTKKSGKPWDSGEGEEAAPDPEIKLSYGGGVKWVGRFNRIRFTNATTRSSNNLHLFSFDWDGKGGVPLAAYDLDAMLHDLIGAGQITPKKGQLVSGTVELAANDKDKKAEGTITITYRIMKKDVPALIASMRAAESSQNYGEYFLYADDARQLAERTDQPKIAADLATQIDEKTKEAVAAAQQLLAGRTVSLSISDRSQPLLVRFGSDGSATSWTDQGFASRAMKSSANGAPAGLSERGVGLSLVLEATRACGQRSANAHKVEFKLSVDVAKREVFGDCSAIMTCSSGECEKVSDLITRAPTALHSWSSRPVSGLIR